MGLRAAAAGAAPWAVRVPYPEAAEAHRTVRRAPTLHLLSSGDSPCAGYAPPCISFPETTRVSPTSGSLPVMIPFTTSKSTTGRGVLLTM